MRETPTTNADQKAERSRHGSTAGAPPHADKSRQRNRQKTLEELHFAMLRVKNKGKKLSISSVALEAGVTPALIHNTYPDLAEAIRAEVGRSTRQQRDEKVEELTKAKERISELRAELAAALADLQKLASTNETLRQEVATLRAVGAAKVALFPPRSR